MEIKTLNIFNSLSILVSLAAITSYHKLGTLKQQIYFSHSFRNQKSEISIAEPKSWCQQCLVPSEVLRESLPLVLAASRGQQHSSACDPLPGILPPWHFHCYTCSSHFVVISPSASLLFFLFWPFVVPLVSFAVQKLLSLTRSYLFILLLFLLP